MLNNNRFNSILSLSYIIIRMTLTLYYTQNQTVLALTQSILVAYQWRLVHARPVGPSAPRPLKKIGVHSTPKHSSNWTGVQSDKIQFRGHITSSSGVDWGVRRDFHTTIRQISALRDENTPLLVFLCVLIDNRNKEK